MRRRSVVLAIAIALLVAAGCGGASDASQEHAGLIEVEALERARQAIVGIGTYGRLTLDTLRRRTSPDGTPYWEAEFVDAEDVRRLCVRMRGGTAGGTVTRDCGPSPASGEDDRPA